MREYFVVMYKADGTYDILEVDYAFTKNNSKYIVDIHETNYDIQKMFSMLNRGHTIHGIRRSTRSFAKHYGLKISEDDVFNKLNRLLHCPYEGRRQKIYNRTAVLLQEEYKDGYFHYDLTYYDYKEKTLKKIKFKGGDRNYTVMAWNLCYDCRINNKQKIYMVDSGPYKSYADVISENTLNIGKADWVID